MKKKFALIFALALVAAGVFVSTAAALRFETGDCYESGPGGTWICPGGVTGQPYAAQLTGAGGCGPALPYQYRVLSGALPPGLSLASNGLISGSPTTTGTYEFYVELSDEDPPSQSWCRPSKSERQFSITVIAGLDLEPSSVPPGTVGVSYSATLSATPAGIQSWTIAEGSLPPGLILGASNGVITGMPNTVGSYKFKIQVSDTEKRSVAREYTINVSQPLTVTPLGIHWEGLHGSEVGVAISTKLVATGGTGTFIWSVTGGSLPAGVALGADGTIAGKPKLAGKFAFTVQVADSEGRTATVSTTLTVAAKLSFKTVTLRAAKVGRVYNAKLVTLGGVTPLKWTILRGTLARGIHFAKKLGMFTGTPKREGTYRVTVQAVDGYGIKTQKTFVLVVKA